MKELFLLLLTPLISCKFKILKEDRTDRFNIIPFYTHETRTMNFDLPPRERIFSFYTKNDAAIFNYRLKQLFNRKPTLGYFAKFASQIIDFSDDEEFNEQILAISELFQKSPYEVLAWNYVYELKNEAFCTSLIFQNDNGEIFHLRNFDYQFLKFTEKIAIMVNYVSKGKIIMRSEAFIGILGSPTLMRSGKYSFSVNSRKRIHDFTAAFNIWEKKRVPNMYFLLMLARKHDDFESFVREASESPWMAPFYLTVAGIQEGQGVIMEMGTHGAEYQKWMKKKGYDVIFITNYDFFKIGDYDDFRREKILMIMKLTPKAHLNTPQDFSQKVLKKFPIFQKNTIYTVSVFPKSSSYDIKFWYSTKNENIDEG